MALIQIQQATKSFKHQGVFSDINLSINQGKSYGFAGHNGCGKSVLFKCICGFSLLDAGSIVVNGKAIGKDVDFIEDAGVVIEAPQFISHLTGFENLKMLAEIKGIIGKEEILDALEKVHLLEEKDKKVKHYSLCMKQKLRIAQAIMESPSILILDEPTNALDKTASAQVRDLLNAYVKGGGTLLMSSHNKDDIDACCDVIYEFDGGKLHLMA